MTLAASSSAPGDAALFVTRENLFNDDFLLKILPKTPEWAATASLADRLRKRLGSLLASEKLYAEITEPNLDKQFFSHVFDELGHVCHVQVRTKAGDFPDYVYFENEATKKSAEEVFANREAFFSRAIALGELKAWDIPLDGGKSKKHKADLDDAIPVGQLYGYLVRNRHRWGILTNGRKWRLYHYDGQWPKVGRYYEIDLPALVQSPNPDAMRYFAYFFRREAFVPDSLGKTPLDRAREGSAEHSKSLAKDLETAVYRALRLAANGFLKWRPNQLDGSNAADQKRIHQNALKFLYRLLFVFKAESVGLLPLDNPVYRMQRSLDALKRRVYARKKDLANPILNDSDEFYQHLVRLFKLIDQGSEAILGKGRDDPLKIPAYNGGLFHQKDSAGRPDFLSTARIGDRDLADVIDLLARGTGEQPPLDGDEAGWVDFTGLEAPQLGTLYEGLLEYQLGFAAGEDYLAVGPKNKELWIPASKHKGPAVADFERFAPEGTFFLRTDKGERHSTGTYYTPDFIVRYIINKTLAPIVERRLADARAANRSRREAILSIRVMDPAMGSGHFLVDAVDFLTPRFLAAVEEDREAGILPSNFSLTAQDAPREILAHCIYGVDLNPMAVELAKVTLWLHTLQRGKPLSFLDHRLRIGNSLLGVNLRRLSRYPTKTMRVGWAKELETTRKRREEQLFEEPLAFPTLLLEAIVGRIQKIDALRDETIEDVKAKESLYAELRASAEFLKIRSLCDAWTAAYFDVYTGDGDEKASKNFQDLHWAMHHSASEREWQEKAKRARLEAIREIAKSKSFFHWAFEFPEVYFEGGALKHGTGFDAIVGNPPYMNIETLHATDPDAEEVFKQFYESGGEGRYDIYVLFVEKGLQLLNSTGEFGYILPNKWFRGGFGRPLRNVVTRRRLIREIVNWGNYYTLFPGAITFVALFFLSRQPPPTVRYVAFPNLRADEPSEVAADRLKASRTTDASQTLDLVVSSLEHESLGDRPWVFVAGDAKGLMDRLKQHPHLGTEADVFEGVTTAAVPVFVLHAHSEDPAKGTIRAWSDEVEAFVELEAELCRPMLNGNDVERWRILQDEDVILWPYETVKDARGRPSHRLIPPERLEKYPLAWAYLNHPKVRQTLEAREPKKIKDPATGEGRKVGKFEGKPDWYQYSYPRSMERFSQPKLALPDAASQGDTAFDADGVVIVDTLYGVVPKPGSPWNIFALQACLNNHLLTWWVRENGSPLKDGFYRFKTKYVEPFPLPAIEWTTPAGDRTKALDDFAPLFGRVHKFSSPESW